MRATMILLAMAVTPVAAQDRLPLVPGTYTNEEVVSFALEAKRPAPPWIGIAVDESGVARLTDHFGEALRGTVGNATMTKDGAIALSIAGGTPTRLRRSRPITCWGSVPKVVKKPDGSDDWYFAAGLKLHDQGGRAVFGGDATAAPPVVLKVRNVVWPSGPNKPSLVLYVYKPGSPDRAEAYSWADPGAKRIGINLRWMQASCTVD